MKHANMIPLIVPHRGELLESIGTKWLIFINSIFIIAGIVLIAAGAIALTTFEELTALIDPMAFYGLIGLGVNIFLFAIVGFIVACYEIKAIELCYAFFTFCFAVALIGGGVAVLNLGDTITELVEAETQDVDSDINKIMACTWELCCNIKTFGTTAQQALISAIGQAAGNHPSCADKMDGFKPVCETLPPTFDPQQPLCVDAATYNQGFTDWAVGHTTDVAHGTLALGGIFFLNFIAAVVDVCNDSDDKAATAAFG